MPHRHLSSWRAVSERGSDLPNGLSGQWPFLVASLTPRNLKAATLPPIPGSPCSWFSSPAPAQHWFLTFSRALQINPSCWNRSTLGPIRPGPWLCSSCLLVSEPESCPQGRWWAAPHRHRSPSWCPAIASSQPWALFLGWPFSLIGLFVDCLTPPLGHSSVGPGILFCSRLHPGNLEQCLVLSRCPAFTNRICQINPMSWISQHCMSLQKVCSHVFA